MDVPKLVYYHQQRQENTTWCLTHDIVREIHKVRQDVLTTLLTNHHNATTYIQVERKATAKTSHRAESSDERVNHHSIWIPPWWTSPVWTTPTQGNKVINLPDAKHRTTNIAAYPVGEQSSQHHPESLNTKTTFNPKESCKVNIPRGVNKANVSRLIKHLNEHAQLSLEALETRKGKLEEYYQAFTKVQSEIEDLAEEVSLDADQDLEREQFDEIYYECSDLISHKLRELHPINNQSTADISQATSTASNSKVIIQQNTLLPKIEIRPFDGNPIEWHSFHDTFQSLVHTDAQIPAVQKFYLLKNSLRGSVATIIESLNASEENYLVAWEMLKQRCDKPRQIIQTHIKLLLELPEISKDSPLGLRTLKEKALMHVNALKALQVPVDSWDAILIYIIIQKLDKATRRTWERSLDNAQMPKFNELIAFLNKQERGDEIEECSTAKYKYNNPTITNRGTNRIEKLSGARGQAYVNRRALTIPHNITLADPEFDKPAEIDALIGTTLFYKLLSIGQISLSNNANAVLQKTLLGWIVAGEVGNPERVAITKSCHLITAVDKQLTRFWEVEEVPTNKHLSNEELTCERFYVDSTIRGSDGRYTVRLPFNDQKGMLGDSYKMALRRFYSLEQKLAKDRILKQQYSEFLREYHDLGHMKEITRDNVKFEGYYIPHHAVVKEANLSTKVRVVFDASAKSTTNIALNDTLMVGPTIQRELVFTIMKFRLHNVVLAADVQKMYRQVKVNNYDAVYQKILWRDNEHDALRVFKLTTVTQGTAPAPFLATRTLQQLAEDESKHFPLAAVSLKNDFYVDDLLTGTSSVERAVELKNQLIKLLRRGGFEFHKWASNKHELAVESNNDNHVQNVCLNTNDQTRKLLGIYWDSIEDTIMYVIKPFDKDERPTKRSILSQIAHLFDPLGLLGPVIILAKLIMQELWKANLNWDESIPQSLHKKWTNLKEALPTLSQFKVVRQIALADVVSYQLHGFCDASEQAYGACIYLRSIDKFNKCSVQLVCAKSRVAPVKTITVPRLELCAAHLLTKLLKAVSEALQISYDKIKLWSDSTITLHWIKASPHTLKTFVANRVAEIQANSNPDDWNHIATDENPADYISRGQAPVKFLSNTHWLHGPAWLSQDESRWNIKELSSITVPDQRITTTLTVTGQVTESPGRAEQDNTEGNDTFERFSSIHKLNRFVALCRRAIANRKLENKVKGNYSVEELQNAHHQIIRVVQQKSFSRDIQRLKEGREVHPKSELLCLTPFLDVDGIIRVGGRLTHAAISYSRKYPIVLPRNHHITKLIISKEHIRNWHAGMQATLNSVRNNYWPIDGKNSTRHIIRKCIRCHRVNPKLPIYVMGDLPKNRVIQSRPFECVGLDYCGPFLLKEKKFRNKGKLKAYVAIFVCFATRAVHMELVTDLTTDTCLEAVKRFCARRGKPNHIYSDNATNFVGAKNEILKIRAFFLSEENQSTLTHSLLNDEINWHFIPPRSPHFGGLWEAAVKSFKQHLYRTVGDAMFTYEQFNTFIIEIESILNSRPLTSISSDPNDLTALTPAHFLIGGSLINIPEIDLRSVPTNRLSIWQHIHKLKQHFWQRWHKEYLNELRTRKKWHLGNGTEITVGKMVTIKEDNLPPMHWSIGRIIAVHSGTDNVVRVATVKTPTGVYKRSITKLAPLPIDNPTDNASILP
ncbi:uncharacterized protein LOC123988783 [Osmia bicornis bicornis]|uniref:uncharacterized protein LOC123988783 n=1 Tax=Osmia bicornis bicornis TaxID=1437191 RepID=UPI001EAF6550|nr:uncharacterized protein LOC123988783 [Osmia bicornis bicornis]